MNFIDFKNLDKNDIELIFKIADELKSNQLKYSNLLNNKYFILFFPETSIRTRFTFEKAIKSLGGNFSLFPPHSLDKNERLEDLIKYIENWSDCLIIRHSDQQKIHELSIHTTLPIINAMSSQYHPCEILSDLYSFRELNLNYLDSIYTFVGENSNISKTWVEAARILDLKLNHVFFENHKITDINKNYNFHTDLFPILNSTDIVLTDSIPENEWEANYLKQYRLTKSILDSLNKKILVNPCPPFNINGEIDKEIIESQYFVGYKFKKNLLYVQQAIIIWSLDIIFNLIH